MAETMYALKPVFDLDAKVDIPTCMYRLPVIQASTPIAGIGGAKSTCPISVEALEARQDAILARLGQLKDQVSVYRKSLGLSEVTITPTNVTKTADIVIRCSPTYPAFSLKGIYSLLISSGLSVHTSCHTHCTVTSLPPNVQSFLPITDVPRSSAQVRMTLIWTEVGKDCELMVSPLAQTVIKGENNIIRYFSRLFPTVFPYESLTNLMEVDTMLDNISSLLWAAPREKQPIIRSLAVNLGKSAYLAGGTLSVADLAFYSCIRQLGLEKDLQPELMKWYLTMAKQLEGKSSRNRNRNSSMRKSMSSSRKPDNKKSPEHEKSPKKEPASAKKGKSPTKEVKIEKNPPKKSGKSSNKNQADQIIDVESNNLVGSVFTKQWPEIKHIFQSEKLTKYLEKNAVGFVAEKLDGSNLAVSSRGVISSRRNILLNKPSVAELERFKFSGVTFSKLVGIFDKIDNVRQHFQCLFPFLNVEVILYGELIQKGTATCKEDKFNYRPRGIDMGDFHIFGGGVAFEEQLTSSQIMTALKHVRGKGFSVISQENELTGRTHLVVLMNATFQKLLQQFGFEKIVEHIQSGLLEAVNFNVDKLVKNKIEGIVINFGDEILKWKGLDEGYPDMYMEQIQELEMKINVDVYKAFDQVATEARKLRETGKKNKNTDVLLARAYQSAMTKLRTLEEQAEDGDVSEEAVARYRNALEEEMMKDCHSNVEYKQKLIAFIESKIKCR